MYLDSAYIAKFYLNEPDSAKVRKLIQTASTRVTSEWSVIEITSAFHRHFREGHLTATQYCDLVQALHQHLDDEVWSLVPLNGRIIRRLSAAMRSLPDNISLRSGDAIQLFSALEAGESEVWSNDRRLLTAAGHFGLMGRKVD